MTIASIPDLRNLRRLLIIRLGAIGDVVHAVPISAALAEAYPNLEISWLIEEIPADIVTGNPYLKEVIVIPRSRWKQGRLRSPRVWREYLGFLGDLRRRRFDVTLDLQGYAKSALFALATGAPYRFGWWRMRDGSHLVSRPLPRRPETVHRVDMFLDVARALGAEPQTVQFPLHIPETARQKIAELLCQGGIAPDRPYAVLNQAAGDPPRRWSPARHAELAAALARNYRLPTVFVGTAAESATCDQMVAEAIAAQGGETTAGVLAPLNLAGKTSIKELAALLDGCAIHIAGDTGSAHIAAALQHPVIGLYGGSDPAFCGPWGQQERVLARRELCHADCSNRRCVYAAPPPAQGSAHSQSAAPPDNAPPLQTARCIETITVEEVLAQVERVLSNYSEQRPSPPAPLPILGEGSENSKTGR